MASMILEPNRYQPDRFDTTQAHLHQMDLSRMEIDADEVCAQKIMQHVLDHFGLTLRQAQDELSLAHRKFGNKWADATEETIDLSFLHAC
jgi:hypothetical protein